jgi:peptidoglycan/LPS O-acetylase OafA/YrhL
VDSNVKAHKPASSPAASAQPEQHRIAALDALRGVAVLTVMLYHLGGTHPGASASGVVLLPGLEAGTHGVDLFFVLSGFLITGILYDTKHREGYFRTFFARRSLRIFPLYYLVVIVAIWALPWIGIRSDWQLDAAEHSGWLVMYCANFLIAFRNEWCLGSFDHFWSLAVEEQFYLVWPLVILWLNRRQAMALCAGLVVSAMLGKLIWVELGGSEVARYVLTPLRLDALAAGAWIALWVRGGVALASVGRWAGIALALLSLILVPVALFHLRLLSLADDLWVAECAALLIVVLAAHESNRFNFLGNCQPLRWLGHYSYGIYVFGNLLIGVFAPVLTAGGLAQELGSPYLGQLVYALILGTTTVEAAVLSWQLFEKHFLRLTS